MFGGIEATLKATAGIPGQKAIQLRGEWAEITIEAEQAVAGEATIIMVDTGKFEDAELVSSCLRRQEETSVTDHVI